MLTVRIKKGYTVNVAGEPSRSVTSLEKPDRVALTPERIPYVKPRLKVQIGDKVKIGTPVFEDKRNPDIRFLSPGGGNVTDINFGPRRVIREIIVALDDVEDREEFPAFSETEIKSIPKKELIQAIMAGGLWPLLRELPFRDIADPEFTPPAVIVSLDAREPFQPLPEVYLNGKIRLFEYGLEILRRLSDAVLISTSPNNSFILQQLKNHLTHISDGVYPADDAGVLLYHVKKTPADNRAWYIDGQDLLQLAVLLQTGQYPVDRVVALGGNLARGKNHILTRWGVPLKHLAKGSEDNVAKARYLVGGIFRGYAVAADSFMGFYDKSLVLLSTGDEKEFFGFAR
ncbi:hypothetical protein ACFL7E_08520, partial [Thermodesulfobacteriota bacterium]